jgi:hypothetical protein
VGQRNVQRRAPHRQIQIVVVSSSGKSAVMKMAQLRLKRNDLRAGKRHRKLRSSTKSLPGSCRSLLSYPINSSFLAWVLLRGARNRACGTGGCPGFAPYNPGSFFDSVSSSDYKCPTAMRRFSRSARASYSGTAFTLSICFPHRDQLVCFVRRVSYACAGGGCVERTALQASERRDL